MSSIQGYFRKGKHRRPTSSSTGRLAAAVTAFVAVGVVSTPGVALADGPMDSIVRCESGGNIRATNPNSTASGKYQFLDSTWRGLGGKGRAKDASEAEQDRMAAKLYATSGSAPWNASRHCWGGKSGASAGAKAGLAHKKHKATTPRTKRTLAPPKRVKPPVGRDLIIVAPGDTLVKLAARHGTTWKALYNNNRNVVKNPNRIFPGQHLKG